MESILKGDDYLCMTMKRFPMNYRQYLDSHRDPIQIPLILAQIVQGLEQVHELGFIHRDLRPENIVLSLDPLEVRIIDFTESFPKTQKTINSLRGSLPYFPQDYRWRDGSKAWDYYALGVIVIESEVTKEDFSQIND